MHLPPRWVVAVSAAVGAAILGDSLLYAVLPAVWPELGLELGMVGVLLSANRFVRIVSNPVAGWVMARRGMRGPFLAAVFAAAGTTMAYAAGLGFAGLLVARGLWGVCWSFLRLGGYLAALDAADDHTRGYYLGFFNGVTRSGSFIAVILGGFLTDLIGFATTVFLFASATALGGLAVWRERPPQPAHSSMPRSATPPAPVSPVVATAAKGLVTPTAPGARMRLWTMYGLVFLHGMAISGLVTATLGLWLGTVFGQSIQAGALVFGVASVTGVLLGVRFLADFLWGPYAGHLSDRFGRRPVIFLAGMVQIMAMVALSLPGSIAWTVVAAVAVFLAAPAVQVSLDAQTGGLGPPNRRAQTMSIYATWLDLGAAVGPLVGYGLASGIGLAWLYRSMALLLVFAGVVYGSVFRGEKTVLTPLRETK